MCVFWQVGVKLRESPVARAPRGYLDPLRWQLVVICIPLAVIHWHRLTDHWHDELLPVRRRHPQAQAVASAATVTPPAAKHNFKRMAWFSS